MYPCILVSLYPCILVSSDINKNFNIKNVQMVKRPKSCIHRLNLAHSTNDEDMGDDVDDKDNEVDDEVENVEEEDSEE